MRSFRTTPFDNGKCLNCTANCTKTHFESSEIFHLRWYTMRCPPPSDRWGKALTKDSIHSHLANTKHCDHCLLIGNENWHDFYVKSQMKRKIVNKNSETFSSQRFISFSMLAHYISSCHKSPMSPPPSRMQMCVMISGLQSPRTWQ